MIFVLDNYDSFVYNLVQYIGEIKDDVQVARNDEVAVQDILNMKPEAIIISPGPCTPKEAGSSVSLVQKAAEKIPILGVCLGHQSIAAAFGGKIIRAKQVVHGKTSAIYHDGKTLYRNIVNPFIATRYHSLTVEKESLPQCFEISSWTDDQEIMGIRHKEFMIEGIQFHPESILTQVGKEILKNFLLTEKNDSMEKILK